MPRVAMLFAPLAIAPALVCGCQAGGWRATAEVTARPPAGWRSASPSTWLAPGKTLAAWAGPEGSSLVLYRTLPAPGATARSVATALANRLDNLTGFQMIKSETIDLASGQAAWVEAVAPGTGDALAPSGSGAPVAPRGKTLVPTRVVAVGLVRPGGVYYLAWHAPDAVFSRIEPDLKATLASLQFADARAPAAYTQN